jgi:hypothetical protein
MTNAAGLGGWLAEASAFRRFMGQWIGITDERDLARHEYELMLKAAAGRYLAEARRARWLGPLRRKLGAQP